MRRLFRTTSLLACATLAGLAAADTDWRIVALNGAPVVETPTLTFVESGALLGDTGCNRFQATARKEEGALVVEGPVATTRMSCPGEALTAQEDAIVALFEGRIGVAYDPFSGALTLSRDGTEIALAAMPVMPSIFEDVPEPHLGRDVPAGDPPYLSGFGRSDALPLHDAPEAAAPVVTTAWLGQVLRNAGCDGAWCEVEALDGSARGWAERQHLEEADSALRSGQDVFDATGVMPCAKGAGAPMGQCVMGVARDGGGSATVVVRRGDGLERALFFRDGAFFSTDSSQAGGGFDTSATHDNGLFQIRIDDERYEIPDAVVFGG